MERPSASVMTHMSTKLRGLSQQWTVLTAHVHAHQIERSIYQQCSRRMRGSLMCSIVS